MLLEGKNALVYGAGAIGAAVARAFAAEGAAVHVANRSGNKAEELAGLIRADGGTAAAAEVDALDEAQVEAFVDSVAASGSVDVSFNLIGIDDVQGIPLTEISFDDYAQPVVKAVRSTFLTARAAARRMAAADGGAILAFGGSSIGSTLPQDHAFGGLLVAFEAVETMRRQFSAEFGANGVRFVTLRTGGVPEAIPASFEGREQLERGLTEMTLLGRTAGLADVGAVAAFVASDRARTMTAATVNVSAGALLDF
jgi:NAD(P)-dependent dehydrogenase (short-subunit alcohol dehydrogenase family)